MISIRKWTGWPLLLVSVAWGGASPGQIPVFNYPNFSAPADLDLQGHASLSDSRLRLTPASSAQAGGAWFAARRQVNAGFETVFQFKISARGGAGGPGGEGFAFLLQYNTLPALGPAGDGLGYDGIPRSLAVEFDPHQNTVRNDPNGNHISVQTRLALANSSDHSASLGAVTQGLPDLGDGNSHTARITYAAATLQVFLDDLTNAILTVPVDLGEMLSQNDGLAWFGFTAATGEAFENHDILSWSFAVAQTPLTVNLTTPVDGASFLSPGPVAIAAGASSTGTVTRVEFFQGTTKIGESSSSPYQFNWNNVLPGSYWLTAVAEDDAGNQSVSPPVKMVAYPASPPIGIHFSTGLNNSNYPLAFAEQAGVVAQRIWNNLASPANGNGSAFNLKSGNGATTTLDVFWDFVGPGEEPAINPALSGDHKLMKTHLADDGGMDGAQTNSTLVVQQVPYPFYDVLVYSDGDNGGGDRAAEFRMVAGSVTNLLLLRDAAWTSFAGTFVEAQSALDEGAGNYVRFNSLTNSSFTLTVSARSATDLTRRAVVNAIQIVPSFNSAAPLRLTRGPYLQVGTPTSMIVRWRTDRPTDSRVRCGLSPTALILTNTDTAMTTEHIVRIPGLLPDTRYFYAVGTTETNLAGPNDCFFMTSPTRGKPTRIWVLGDSGTANANAAAVKNAYYHFVEEDGLPTDLWLMLGDNAYDRGTDSEHQRAIFDMYPSMLRQSVLWPTLGNHETSQSHAHNESTPYYQIFSFPTRGEAGGVASGTKQYYSFDYGNVHFICLDSMTSERTTNGLMYAWLEADLVANTNDWTIAYWHHPPYTKGSHDSDDDGADFELIEMRQTFLPLLESHGADLVLSGHSHCYERSFLLHGHYGYSEQLRPDMIKDHGSGRPLETGAYRKDLTGPAPGVGTVYAVVGSSGQATFVQPDWPHPAMSVSLLQLGSMILDIHGNTLQARWLRETEVVQDSFTIVKEVQLRITALRVTDNRVAVTWQSVPGKTYSVQRTAGITPLSWQTVSSGIVATNTLTTLPYLINAAEPTGFYRVQATGNLD